MTKKLKDLSLSYTRELLTPLEIEKGESSKRISYYASHLDKYFILIFSLRKHQLKETRMNNMIVIPTDGFNRLDALFKMYKLGKEICRQNEIDIIQAQDPLFTGFVGCLLGQKYRKPLNVCVYGADPYDENWLGEKITNLILAPLARYVLSRCDGIQVDGSKVLNSLIKKGRISPSKIFLKPMVPQDIKQFKVTDGEPVRKKLLKNGEEKILLFVGRLAKQKNIPFLLNCYKKILQEFPKARLVIVGEGREEEKLKSLAERLEIQDKTTWIKGVPYLKITEFFKAADIFVLPSLYEGFPRVVMEAAMAGKPIVSTDVGGTEDVIIDGKNGFIIPQENEKDFIEKILFLLKNSKIAQKMGKKGQEIMETKFDPEQTRLEQINIWHQIVQK